MFPWTKMNSGKYQSIKSEFENRYKKKRLVLSCGYFDSGSIFLQHIFIDSFSLPNIKIKVRV